MFFDGFDITKEIQYFKGVPDLVARGIACLIVDGPGNGESVRFRDLPLIAETEKYGTAAYEYLAGRKEVDAKRIGVMAISLGGYYAPRAASLEPRYAACIAWGAQWDYYDTWKRRFDLLDSGKVPSLSVPPEHLMWVFGVKSRAEAMKKLEGFRLDGIVQKMKCPFLLLHGAGDEQIPLAIAEKCFAAVGSKEKTLKVFQREEGGFHHCQVDNVTIGTNYHVGLGGRCAEAGDVTAFSGSCGPSASPARSAGRRRKHPRCSGLSAFSIVDQRIARTRMALARIRPAA